MSDASPDPESLVDDCVNRLPAQPASCAADAAAFGVELERLVQAVCRAHAHLAFDRTGRPAAVAAIRHALPITEAELLDAVMEDVACELAAVQEAWYRIASRLRRGAAP